MSACCLLFLTFKLCVCLSFCLPVRLYVCCLLFLTSKPVCLYVVYNFSQKRHGCPFICLLSVSLSSTFLTSNLSVCLSDFYISFTSNLSACLSVCLLSTSSDLKTVCLSVCLYVCVLPFLTSKPVCLYVVNNFWQKTCVSFCLPVIYLFHRICILFDLFLLQIKPFCLPFLHQKTSVCLPLFGRKLDPNPRFSEAGSMIRTRIRVKME